MAQLTPKTKAFVDISLDFTPNPVTGDLSVLRNERAINNSLKNLILIMPKEVPFRSDVGSSVSGYLFELIDEGTAGLITLEIERSIKYNEPRVKLLNVTTEAYPDQNQFVVTVKYRIIGYDTVFEFSQILEPTR